MRGRGGFSFLLPWPLLDNNIIHSGGSWSWVSEDKSEGRKKKKKSLLIWKIKVRDFSFGKIEDIFI